MPRKISRNAQGNGTIRQRKSDGLWEARFTVGRDPATGKQVQKSIYGKTQKEVAIKLRKVTTDVEDGIYTEPTKLTVGQWLDVWTKDYLLNVKPSTVASYRQVVKRYLKPALNAIKLQKLTAPMIQSLINKLTDEGLSSKTVKNIYGVLHKATTQAQGIGYITNNPLSACILPRVEKAKIEPFDEAEIAAFIKAIKGYRHENLFTLVLFTGLRQAEVLGLQWSCVDFEKGTILIDKQLQRPRGKGNDYYFTSPKNDKPRTVTPAPFIMDMLKKHKKQQTEYRIRAGQLWNDGGFPDLVFTNELGNKITYNPLLASFKKILMKANIPPHRFHDLRHTYAVSSLQAGDDIKTVQGNLGHHTAAFTLDQYGHVTQDMKKASAMRMEQYINKIRAL